MRRNMERYYLGNDATDELAYLQHAQIVSATWHDDGGCDVLLVDEQGNLFELADLAYE